MRPGDVEVTWGRHMKAVLHAIWLLVVGAASLAWLVVLTVAVELAERAAAAVRRWRTV